MNAPEQQTIRTQIGGKTFYMRVKKYDPKRTAFMFRSYENILYEICQPRGHANRENFRTCLKRNPTYSLAQLRSQTCFIHTLQQREVNPPELAVLCRASYTKFTRPANEQACEALAN